MPSPRTLRASRTLPVEVGAAFDAVLPMPLPRIFCRRFAALPPIKDVRDQSGVWGTVGQTRTIVLADRGTMRETLTAVSPGASFGYRIEPMTGPLTPLVSAAEGTWAFAPAGTGVEVSWQWVVEPTRAGSMVMPVFARMWQGYARQALEEIERALVPR
ncbi:SRPBCC family protein [Nocardioides alpinus]|nr:SRPBCC family protein [Nocardioides alpinus]PKH42883.1 SRPBCC family protein [Nocardioides alpinus]